MVPALSGKSRNRRWANKVQGGKALKGEILMTTGMVMRVIEGRGFGFINNPSGKDVFFHYTQLDGIDFEALKEGQNVSYKVGLGAKGFEAKDIRLYKGDLDLYNSKLHLRG
jgi:cold shock protein